MIAASRPTLRPLSLDKFFQPSLFDVVFELNAERTVVPAVGETAIDFAAGEDITAALAEIDNHIKRFFAVFHLC